MPFEFFFLQRVSEGSSLGEGLGPKQFFEPAQHVIIGDEDDLRKDLRPRRP